MASQTIHAIDVKGRGNGRKLVATYICQIGVMFVVGQLWLFSLRHTFVAIDGDRFVYECASMK